MYSLKKTASAFLAATKIKQSTHNIEVRTAVDAFFASLGANAIVITDDVDPTKKIIIIDNVDPAGGIVISDDDNPESIVITDDDNPKDIVILDDDNPEDVVIVDDDNPLNAAIRELKSISGNTKKESENLLKRILR